MNKADKEIIAILKETFGPKQPFLDPDAYLRSLTLKLLLVLSVLGTLTVVIVSILGREVPPAASALMSAQLALFFGLLFIHINAKSENSSSIIFVLTWLSMVLALYLGNT